MPDKHEVGGSSPLGPTSVQKNTNGEITTTFYGGVAQLGEHLPCKQGVMGSNPIISTTLNNTNLLFKVSLVTFFSKKVTHKMLIENRIKTNETNR